MKHNHIFHSTPTTLLDSFKEKKSNEEPLLPASVSDTLKDTVHENPRGAGVLMPDASLMWESSRVPGVSRHCLVLELTDLSSWVFEDRYQTVSGHELHFLDAG